MKLLVFLTHSMKYIWYSPQKSKYPLYIFQSTYHRGTIFNYLYVYRHRAIYFIELLYRYPRSIYSNNA